jgi:hypothetical protein
MAEALIESWAGAQVGVPWYLDGRPVPGDDSAVLDDVSSADLRALGKHLLPLAWDILGLVMVKDGEDGDEGKAEPPSAASNGSTPTSGSAASTGPATTEVPADPATSLSGALPTL